MPEIEWSAELTKFDLAHLTQADRDELIEALNDAVMAICDEYEVGY
jgi:hypothetical protein